MFCDNFHAIFLVILLLFLMSHGEMMLVSLMLLLCLGGSIFSSIFRYKM